MDAPLDEGIYDRSGALIPPTMIAPGRPRTDCLPKRNRRSWTGAPGRRRVSSRRPYLGRPGRPSWRPVWDGYPLHMAEPDLSFSPALAKALDTYKAFAVLDDGVREKALKDSDPETLRAFVDQVGPLVAEIDSVLDRFDVATHPLPGALEDREFELHSLAQACIEAKMDLEGMP